MPLTKLPSMKTGILMIINSWRDGANFTAQMITEGAVLCTKTTKSPVYYGHTLPRMLT